MNKPTILLSNNNRIVYYYNKDNKDYLINVQYAANN